MREKVLGLQWVTVQATEKVLQLVPLQETLMAVLSANCSVTLSVMWSELHVVTESVEKLVTSPVIVMVRLLVLEPGKWLVILLEP
jgi:hypothetical protein